MKNYQVEAIRKDRFDNGHMEYLVKWRRFPESENTWQPQENFLDPSILEQYKRQRRYKQKRIIYSNSAKNQKAIRTPAINQNSLPSKSMQRQMDNDELSEEIEEPYSRSNNTSSNRPEILYPTLKIEGMHLQSDNSFWFHINNNGKKQSLSREEVIKMNYMAVIEFYESNIRFSIKLYSYALQRHSSRQGELHSYQNSQISQHLYIKAGYPAQSSMSSEGDFEVDEILDYRLQSGRQVFKVKWKGYSLKDCTWEPLKNLANCMDMVKQFKMRKGLWFKRAPQKEVPVQKSIIKKIQSESEQEKETFEPKTNNEPSQHSENHQKETETQMVCNEQAQQEQKEDKNDDDQKRVEVKSAQRTIVKMLKNKREEISFRVQTENGTEIMTRKDILKSSIKMLLDFYEKFINFATPPPKP